MRSFRLFAHMSVLLLIGQAASAQVALKLSSMRKVADVDERYVSYNIEAVEVTGGRFWKPYSKEVDELLSKPPKALGDQAVGTDPALFQYRSPIDLTNPKLRKLAAALGPAYLRVSGTWRNFTYFQDDDLPSQKPPKGYNGVMTRAQWKGVVDFSKAVDAGLVTSVAISPGTRDAAGLWNADQTRSWLEYTKNLAGKIAATEFMNEPTFPGPGGAPEGYNAAAFARDARVFKQFLREESPGTVFLGPGGVGEGVSLGPAGMPLPRTISSEEILKATGPVFDAFSYHFYGTVSKRCAAGMGPGAGIKPESALTPEWFGKNLAVEEFYAKLRDRYLPGKDLWLTETGEAACGGDKFASEFVDSFRYTDQLGTLAQKGVKVVMQNTLASSDYGLLDEDRLNPRPNYWVALLWKRFMGTRVLDPGVAKTDTAEVFAHCAKGKAGAVAVVAMNMDKTAAHSLSIPAVSERYTLTAPDLYGSSLMLNGKPLETLPDGAVPEIRGESVKGGVVELKPLSISFFLVDGAKNDACR